MDANNTILVYEENGNVLHRFCPESEARQTMNKASDEGKGCSLFIVDDDGAKLIYDISPQLRDRVGDAKAKIRLDMTIRDAMDRNGIPRDIELRKAIYKTIQDCQLA